MHDLEFRQFIERVKLRSPVEVVIGDRVSGLRARGALHWACCPFHQEKTPSFAVDPRRGTWRCFGACGEGGDVLTFVERFDGLSFLEALRLLARQCGEEMPELRGRARGAEAALEARHDLLRWAAEFYRSALRGSDGEAARAYLQRRGLSEAVQESFGIGWASESGQALVGAAQRDKKPLDWLAEAGLVRRAENGRPYDFFRGRVLIPIRDRLGRVVGFGGRHLDLGVRQQVSGEGAAAQGPKYINTPETPLFHKGRLIFGLDLAASAIRTARSLLVVEGYTDVMAAHQAGWKNVVAVLGTATTADHAALIRRTGARTVVLVFDGDEAGRKASQRALAGLLELPVELRVAVLPEGRDPGDLLVDEAGRAAFRACVEGAREWFDWSLSGLAGKRGSELSIAVEELFQLLAKLGRPLERSTRLAEIAQHLALPEADVRAQWAVFARAQRPAARAEAPLPAVPRAPASLASSARGGPAPGGNAALVARAYAQLFGALLLDNSLVPLYADLARSSSEDGCPEELALLFRTLLELHEHDESGAPIDASALMTALGDHPARERVVALQALAEVAESAAILARDQARWIERARSERQLDSLKSVLGATGDEGVLERMHLELRSGRVPTADPASVRSP